MSYEITLHSINYSISSSWKYWINWRNLSKGDNLAIPISYCNIRNTIHPQKSSSVWMDKCLNAWHPPKRLNALTPPPKRLNVWSHDGWSNKLYFSFPSLQTPFHVLWKYVCISWYGMVLVSHEHSITSHDITWHHMTSYNIIWHHDSTQTSHDIVYHMSITWHPKGSALKKASIIAFYRGSQVSKTPDHIRLHRTGLRYVWDQSFRFNKLPPLWPGVFVLSTCRLM